jgi:hypothetical protein
MCLRFELALQQIQSHEKNTPTSCGLLIGRGSSLLKKNLPNVR